MLNTCMLRGSGRERPAPSPACRQVTKKTNMAPGPKNQSCQLTPGQLTHPRYRVHVVLWEKGGNLNCQIWPVRGRHGVGCCRIARPWNLDKTIYSPTTFPKTPYVNNLIPCGLAKYYDDLGAAHDDFDEHIAFLIKNSGSVRLKAQLLLTQRFDNTCLPQAYISILNLYGNYTFYKKKQNQTLYDNSKQPASKLLILIPLLLQLLHLNSYVIFLKFAGYSIRTLYLSLSFTS